MVSFLRDGVDGLIAFLDERCLATNLPSHDIDLYQTAGTSGLKRSQFTQKYRQRWKVKSWKTVGKVANVHVSAGEIELLIDFVEFYPHNFDVGTDVGNLFLTVTDGKMESGLLHDDMKTSKLKIRHTHTHTRTHTVTLLLLWLLWLWLLLLLLVFLFFFF